MKGQNPRWLPAANKICQQYFCVSYSDFSSSSSMLGGLVARMPCLSRICRHSTLSSSAANCAVMRIDCSEFADLVHSGISNGI